MPQTRTTVALVADSHGFLDPRVAEIACRADVIVHAGDVGAQSILEQLGAGGGRVIAVAGNNDTPRHWPAADRRHLRRLPAEAALELPGGVLAVEHGHRFPARTRHRRLRQAHPDAAAVVCGHSHRRALDREQVPWILNPGACGRSRAYGGPGCLLLHASAGAWRIETHCFEALPRGRTRPA